jgi:dinuclear metal center YbgI/SA1388 family protein
MMHPQNGCIFFFETMPKLKEIIELVERIAPPVLAEEWDNSGLQVGDPGAAVSSVLIALDPVREVLDEARKAGAGLLITHHPFFFSPIRSLDLSKGQGALLNTAVREGIAIYSAHTSLDKARPGVSDALAVLLGLKKTGPIEQDLGWPSGFGLGRVGDLPKKASVRELALKLKKALGSDRLRCAGDPERLVKRVAVCGGSGAVLIDAALAAGAEAYVTGDIKYHDALYASEEGLTILDAGHYYTERYCLDWFAKALKGAFNEAGFRIKVEVSGAQSGPWTDL